MGQQLSENEGCAVVVRERLQSGRGSGPLSFAGRNHTVS